MNRSSSFNRAMIISMALFYQSQSVKRVDDTVMRVDDTVKRVDNSEVH